MEQSMTAKEIEGYFEKTVDEVMDDDVYLGKLVEFMISYCFHAAPRDKTLKEARQVQVDTYMVDMHDEINNNFKSLVEYNTLSDNAWTTWQYVNSYDDWALKKEALGQKVAKQKHKLQSKFTSNGHLRFQPMANSEGMVLYQKMLKWYAEFMRHSEFTGKVRKMANKLAKSFNMLPTFTEDLGPRQKRPQVDVAGDSDEAEELDLLDIDMPSLPPVDLNNVENGNNVENRNDNRETGLSDASDRDEDIVQNVYMA
jgi:hypothetical protein